MKSQVNAVKDTPIRIKILKRAFEEGWNLEQVNSELEKHFCERLYARNRYEAGLIYAFQNRISYEAWKELYQKYIEQFFFVSVYGIGQRLGNNIYFALWRVESPSK